MRPKNKNGSPYGGLLVGVLLTLFVVLAGFAIVAWVNDGVSCTANGTSNATSGPTVTLPPSSELQSTTTVAPSTTTTTAAPVAPLDFDGEVAMRHLKALADDIGPRKSGTQAEEAALGYATTYLQSLGYDVRPQEVSLPGGLVSHNLAVTKQGASDQVIIVGGHIDTVAVSPGANDNASGVAVVLELARDLRDADIVPTVQLVVFGAEEMTDSNPDHHHYGSRQFVQALTDEETAALVGMISVDMVGYGSVLTVRTMERGPQLLRDMVDAYSDDHGLDARRLKDKGKYGWSDHEPFELAGYPAVWVEWREDPAYHTAGDTYSHCDPDDVQRVGTMLLGFLAQLSEADLETLAAAREI